mgnify:CR=1 FL=1
MLILKAFKISIYFKKDHIMKISVTDKFLWDVYHIINTTGDIIDFITKPATMANLPGPKNPIFKKYQKELGSRKFSQLIWRLKRSNYIKAANLKEKKAIMLTREGIDKILKISFAMEKMIKRNDGKWVMLIFDIPEKYGKSRNLLRNILKNLGYKMFQQSVWITPYDVSEKTEKLLQFYSLDSFIRIFLIEEL